MRPDDSSAETEAIKKTARPAACLPGSGREPWFLSAGRLHGDDPDSVDDAWEVAEEGEDEADPELSLQPTVSCHLWYGSAFSSHPPVTTLNAYA